MINIRNKYFGQPARYLISGKIDNPKQNNNNTQQVQNYLKSTEFKERHINQAANATLETLMDDKNEDAMLLNSTATSVSSINAALTEEQNSYSRVLDLINNALRDFTASLNNT